MMRDELDRLLAGYATGQLSEADRRLLMQAALEDQAVFDALVAEEPLRDLLADPVARREILDSLPPVKVRQTAWWRAPWTWALAGSLAAGLVVGLALWQKRPEAVLVAVQKPVEAPAPPAPPALPAQTKAPEAKLVHREEARARMDVKEVVPPVVARPEPAPETKQRSNMVGGVVGGVIGGVIRPPAAPETARQEPAKAAEADAVAAANVPMKDERQALQAASEAFRAKRPATVTAFIEAPGGARTRLPPGATVDRGTVVVLEAEGPVQILKGGGEVVDTIAAGLKRTVRLSTDKAGEQRYTLIFPDLPGAAPRPAAFAARDTADKAAAPAGRVTPEIFFTVR